MNGLRNFLSVDEMRISILVLSFFMAFLCVMYLFLSKQNVDPGLLDLTKTLIYSIAGVNGVQAISYGFSGYYNKVDANTGINPITGMNQGNLTPSTMATSGETEMKPSVTSQSTSPIASPTIMSTTSTSKPTI